jgi:hypothetical protein
MFILSRVGQFYEFHHALKAGFGLRQHHARHKKDMMLRPLQ